jgi:hypothetical protein
MGQFEEGLKEGQEAARLEPNVEPPYRRELNAYICLDRLLEADQIATKVRALIARRLSIMGQGQFLAAVPLFEQSGSDTACRRPRSCAPFKKADHALIVPPDRLRLFR